MDNKKEIKDLLVFFQRANQLKSVPRYSSSLWKDGDTVAEHSWRLALMVYTIGSQFKIGIDLNKAIAMAMIHDLAESLTGDIDAVNTYNAYQEKNKQISKQNKHVAEVKAMKNIMGGLFFGKDMLELWEEFEAQESTEAKFVKALDKLEAFLHLADKGTSSFKQEEFHADYADAAIKNFDEATQHFPELSEMLVAVKDELKTKFEAAGVEWKE